MAGYTGGQVDLTKDESTGVATITLNNPDRRNALSGHMMVQLADAISNLEEWKSGKGVLLCANGSFFCSGGDLNTIRKINNPEGGLRMSIFVHDTLSRLQKLPMISVAVVQGKALGGGAELTLSCDFRLMTLEAKLQFVQVKMGVTPGWRGGTRLVHLVGPAKALQLLVSCEKLSAQDCLQTGLASAILDTGHDSHRQALNWLLKNTAGSTEVVRATKQVVANAQSLPLEESLRRERLIFSTVWGGPANKAALQENIKHR